MLRELRHAILPPHHLTNIFRDWKTIVAQLGSSHSWRNPDVAADATPIAKLTLMGAPPATS